jgi:hypothetical protein
MTRAHHVTHSYTAIRIERIRSLIAAFRLREMMREDIADLLSVSPSGARKYVADLRDLGVIEIARYVDGTATSMGSPVFRLALDAAAVDECLDSLPVRSYARKAPTSESLGERAGPGRRFHIMADDDHYAIRVINTLPVHEPMMAHFFTRELAEVRA